jgi:hypothetical protein
MADETNRGDGVYSTEAMAEALMTGKAREVCGGKILRLPAKDLTAIIAHVNRRRLQQKQRCRLLVVTLLCSPLVVGAALKLFGWLSGWPILMPNSPVFPFLLLLPGIGIFAYWNRETSRLQATTRALNYIRDPQAIGPLLETIMDYKTTTKEAEDALVRLLPQLSAADGVTLSPNQRDCFFRILTRRVDLNKSVGEAVRQRLSEREADLKIAMLRAVALLGDRRLIPYIERLAANTRHGTREQRVGQAAKECLVILRQQSEQQQVSDTLLRASDTVFTTPDVLLRPATGQENTESKTLLRVSDSPSPTETHVRPISGNMNTGVEQLLRPATGNATTEPQLL